MKKEYIYLLIGIGIGVVAANKIRQLPGGSKLPTL